MEITTRSNIHVSMTQEEIDEKLDGEISPEIIAKYIVEKTEAISFRHSGYSWSHITGVLVYGELIHTKSY